MDRVVLQSGNLMFYEPGPILRPVNTRRIQILDAAAELIADQGFAQTSVDAVIARAVVN